MPSREQIRFSQPLADVRLARNIMGSELAARAEILRLQEREQSAFERGRLEGEKALSEQLMKQRGDLLEFQNGILSQLREAIPRVLAESEQAVVELAFEVATKLVAGMEVDAKLVEAAVQEALTQIEHSSSVEIHLHPNDLALLELVNSPLLASNVAGERIEFKTSSEVTTGGCMVETSFGTIDARRETKVARMREALALPV